MYDRQEASSTAYAVWGNEILLSYEMFTSMNQITQVAVMTPGVLEGSNQHTGLDMLYCGCKRIHI